jgi:hypothetical protein
LIRWNQATPHDGWPNLRNLRAFSPVVVAATEQRLVQRRQAPTIANTIGPNDKMRAAIAGTVTRFRSTIAKIEKVTAKIIPVAYRIVKHPRAPIKANALMPAEAHNQRYPTTATQGSDANKAARS